VTGNADTLRMALLYGLKYTRICRLFRSFVSAGIVIQNWGTFEGVLKLF